MRAGAVPGMGLVTPFAGGSETRPAGHDAGLPGAGCPGSARRRYHEARDRTEPKSRGFGESRGRAPEGERVRQKRRAPRPRPAATLRLRGAVSDYAPFGAPPPSLGGPFVNIVGKARGANKKRSARMTKCVLPHLREEG